MARKQNGKSGAEEVHTHLSIRVDDYEASLSTLINHAAYEPQYGWQPADDDPVYQNGITLRVLGTSIWPDKRAGDQYEITLSADNSPSRNLEMKLRDLAELDEFGTPRYRAYRGREVPIYKQPPDFGLLDKVRGLPSWRSWISVKPSLAHSWLTLLAARQDLFIALHECRKSRVRSVRGLALHTHDPYEM